MKISSILSRYDKGVSFEFFPPKTAKSKESLVRTIGALKKYQPLYVSMTYGAAGGTQDRTREAVDMLLKEKELLVMPHLTCIGAQKETIISLLGQYRQKGVENIMALRGDPPGGDSKFDFLKHKFHYARDLVVLIKKYGHFCVGVAVYPEGHIETSSLEEDIEHTKQKIDIGVDFAVTQMFFDNTYYYRMLERMRKKNINIPILPGIFPLTDIAKVKQFTSIARTTIPKDIEQAMERLSADPQDMRKAGIDFTIRQCRDLINNGARQLHFFTLNQPQVMTAILDAIK